MATFERVKKVVVEQLDVSEDEVTPDASFVEDLGADSLDVVELVMGLEEEFDVEIPDEDVVGVVQRVANMFDRRKVRVSSECKHFIQEHREFRYDVRKAMKTGVETVIEDGRHPTVDAFRLFASTVNFWRLQ